MCVCVCVCGGGGVGGCGCGCECVLGILCTGVFHVCVNLTIPP